MYLPRTPPSMDPKSYSGRRSPLAGLISAFMELLRVFDVLEDGITAGGNENAATSFGPGHRPHRPRPQLFKSSTDFRGPSGLGVGVHSIVKTLDEFACQRGPALRWEKKSLI